MQATTTLAVLISLVAVGQSDAGPLGGGQFMLAQATPADSAHTLFQPGQPDAGRAGQTVQLPQGGVGVTTGGTSHYQTYEAPGGGGVAVPDGNTSSLAGSGGRGGVSAAPR